MIIPLLIATILAGSAAEDPKSRIARIEDSLLAPCCWQETLKTHRSEVALKMKAEIARMVSGGRTDSQIFDVFKQRYGNRVMVEPEGRAWWLALTVPVFVGILGLWFVVHLVRRWQVACSQPASQLEPPCALAESDDDF
jgi:cytochrome c-type biogenesis protein CcmH